MNVSDLHPIPEQVGPDVFKRPKGIAVYNRATYARDMLVNSSCSYLNGGCEHICLATPNGPRCACPDKLNFDNGTECSPRTYTCPQVYTGKKGQIRSPGYPGYKNNLHCMIIIRMRNNQHEQLRIQLYVEDFDLQDKYDYLMVGSTKLSGSILSRYNRYTVSSTQEDLKLLFVTDHSVVGRGFNLVFSVHKAVGCNSDRPCHNGGTCVNDEYCMCPDGFPGDWCDHDIDKCASNPCQNSGTCVNKNNTFECRCRGYYRGSVCQYDVNTCRNHPCMNGGTCHSLLDAYQCDCVDGFSGDVCDSRKY
ncbi:hypothetical protein NP493_1396g00005 [Ridgeia piscesae]|uniref:Uncharacterized protein n=1 Tax=Ridgeia piscesae TaxID=27915 RepID=A0AAD9K5E9_RIDPI|nr:hypothetical protein NP493_1396g00005 [Ridgeia piscesae]